MGAIGAQTEVAIQADVDEMAMAAVTAAAVAGTMPKGVTVEGGASNAVELCAPFASANRASLAIRFASFSFRILSAFSALMIACCRSRSALFAALRAAFSSFICRIFSSYSSRRCCLILRCKSES